MSRPLENLNNASRGGTCVHRVGQTEVTRIRSWSAHERIGVMRATSEEGKR